MKLWFIHQTIWYVPIHACLQWFLIYCTLKKKYFYEKNYRTIFYTLNMWIIWLIMRLSRILNSDWSMMAFWRKIILLTVNLYLTVVIFNWHAAIAIAVLSSHIQNKYFKTNQNFRTFSTLLPQNKG